MKTIFFGTPDFALPTLRALVAADLAPELVVTQPSKRRARRGKVEHSPLGKGALELGLPLMECEKIGKGEEFEQIAAIEPELMVVVAFGQILRKNVLNLAAHGCINLHPSMLPAYRGAAPIQRAIIDGVEESGITVMQLVRALDAGPILAQQPFVIDANENAAEAQARAAEIGAGMVVDVVKAYAAATPPSPVPQDDSQATYAHMLAKEDGKIDFSAPALDIHNLVRGVQPWPGAYCEFNGEVLKVHHACMLEGTSEKAAGEIIAAGKNGIDVACGDGILRILEVQAPSKPRRKVADYLNGAQLKVGDRFA